ncbi:MAG: hypothetical protein OQK78_03410 [Gammaproteobacteria bacterium]|nr:hypothetical protein [Gammaproteobacteria bacterium]
MIRVTARLVDGGVQEFTEGDSFITRLHLLQKSGYEGKELVHELITDDWGAPPVYVEITGTTSEGENINARIPYS